MEFDDTWYFPLTKVMRYGKIFEVRYIFVKMYWENQYILTGIYQYIFDKYQTVESWKKSKIPI